MTLADTIDTYWSRAQLKPAQFTLLPVLVTVGGQWAPAAPESTVGILGLTILLVLPFLMAPFVRLVGRSVEARLCSEWGGMPTSRWMLRSANQLDRQTKARFRAYLERHIDGWEAPSQADEETDREGALARYDSAVRWLRDRTRDRRRFSLVFRARVSYRLRRNAYGLRWVGIISALACVAVNVDSIFDVTTIRGNPVSIIEVLALLISVAAIGFWLGVVSKRWVRDAADAEARALLATCDSDWQKNETWAATRKPCPSLAVSRAT